VTGAPNTKMNPRELSRIALYIDYGAIIGELPPDVDEITEHRD